MKDFNKIIKSLKVENDELGWFSSADLIFTQYISNIEIFNEMELLAIAERILKAQDSFGFFNDENSTKSHNKYHRSAYAISCLYLIKELTKNAVNIRPALKLMQNNLNTKEAFSKDLSFLDQVHQWRGSHTFGGIAALTEFLLRENLVNENVVVNHYLDIQKNNGLWCLAGSFPQVIFDSLYRFKHNHIAAKYGAAAHLYWLFTPETNLKVDYEVSCNKLIDFYNKNGAGIVEDVPYCLDYDLLYILKFLSCRLNINSPLKPTINSIFLSIGNSILDFILSYPNKLWLHAFPGALAALEVCCNSAEFMAQLQTEGIFLNDPMEVTIWL